MRANLQPSSDKSVDPVRRKHCTQCTSYAGFRGTSEELNGGKRSDHSGHDHQSESPQKRKERRSRCNLPDVRNERWGHQDGGGLGGRHYDAEKAHATVGNPSPSTPLMPPASRNTAAMNTARLNSDICTAGIGRQVKRSGGPARALRT